MQAVAKQTVMTQALVERATARISGRVLVIDDDASLRFALEAVLGDAGLTVVSSASGAAGLQAFEASGADAVLTDLAMPEMDGLEVLSRLRALDPGVPVIMLTAHGSERVAVAAMKAGAYDYLPKPFDPDEIALAVRRAIETRAVAAAERAAAHRERARPRHRGAESRPCGACSRPWHGSRPRT